jgi:hypothetical protein
MVGKVAPRYLVLAVVVEVRVKPTMVVQAEPGEVIRLAVVVP